MSRQVYFEHDDRTPSANIYRPPGAMGRRMKFTEQKGYRRGKSRLDIDGDVDMMSGSHGSGGERRYNPYGSRNHSRKKHKNKSGHKSSRHNRNGLPMEGGDSWYKITIPFGRKCGKHFIYNAIKSNMNKSAFIPINFRFDGSAAEFFVEDFAAAREIRDVNRRVTTPDGFKMAVQMIRCPIRVPLMDTDTTEILKTYMSSRYDVNFHTLNLTKFHADEGMKACGLYVPLKERVILAAVGKIIKEHIPELEVLNISDNRIFSLEPLSSISGVCKQLKTLNLMNNKIPSIGELNFLKGLELTNLVLDGNPLCDGFKDKSSYISAVRDRFPKLLELDGHALPAPIGFDLGPETFPVSKKSFFAAEDVKDLVIQFLDQYYTIYDSGDRTKLLDAYHDHANFSLCLSKNNHKASGSILSAYNHDNRNLLKTLDFNQRFQLLKQGKLSIVSALSDLPQTMHDPTSFSVDIFHISPGLMSFSVVGVFKEVGADINNATLKTFSRTYVVVAQGSGFVITNETLFIAHASQDQQAKAFKVPAPTPSPSPAPSTDEKSTAEKQMLVVELSKQTRMNLDFSAKCLEENEWDFQRSMAVFLKFQSEGKLPPEAFIAM